MQLIMFIHRIQSPDTARSSQEVSLTLHHLGDMHFIFIFFILFINNVVFIRFSYYKKSV